MKIITLISGGDVGGAKTHVLSLLEGLGKTQTVRLVCFTDGPFAGEARQLGIDTEILSGSIPQTIRALTDNEDMTIAKLPEELREDVIVLEITYANDQTDTKALTVTLQDNGQFFAKFVNYKITDADTFVKRPDAKVVPRAELYGSGDAA